MVKECFITMCGENKILVLDSLDNLFFCLLLQQLFLGVSFDQQHGQNAVKDVSYVMGPL